MAIINNSFNGKLNLDRQAYRIQNGDYIDALNITRDASGEGQDIVVANSEGNTLVSYNLPTGINKVIGKFDDKIRNRVYIFIWNSYDQDLIIYYDKDNDTMVTLIQNLVDTDGDVLNFNPSKKINHIDIIYRDTDGDLVFWTDGNVTPRKMNVKHIEDGVYTTIKTAYIESAKAPPLSPVGCVYGSDTNRNANALRRKLFQFTSRFVYDDYEKSTFSTYSKIPLPIGFYGSDNDIDSTSNNFITLTVETGDENIKRIEIAMRNNIGNAWGDFVLVASLDKEQLGIPDNTTYDFLFYNDAIYPIISDGVQYNDGVQSVPLFYWTPQLADCQVLANGNTPVYGAITEGYDNYPISELDVTITAENKTNVPPDADPPALTYFQSGSGLVFSFTVSGTVPVGTLYSITGVKADYSTFRAEYISQSGDDTDDVAMGMFLAGNVDSPGYMGSVVDSNFILSPPVAPFYIVNVTVIAGSGSSGDTISTEKTWLWDANYVFGIVYVDEQNRDMPGVTTFANPVDVDNDFLVTTPSFSLDGSDVQTPVISASINHTPPEGAVKYYWVRRRLTYGTFMMYETCDYQDPSDGYLYFCLANIEKFKEANSQFIYGTAPITDESRIKIIAGVDSGSYNGDLYTQDYQILGTVTRTLTSGSSPDDDKTFIKVKKPDGAISPAYRANMLVMIYTPALNPTSEAESVYWEWGEAYDIYEEDGVRYHRGGEQDQTASQPATFEWPEGDVYFHTRDMYSEILSDPYDVDTLNIMDANYSDFFDSAVNDNGRGQAIEVNAQHLYNPVLVRFGGEYQAGTSVNKTNNFYYENFEEADRQWGDIRKMFVRGRYLRAYQKLNIGVFPILMQIIRDTSGNPLEANSDILINKVNYPYSEQVGIGDIPESFASDNLADYFASNYRNVVCRLSQDGVTILSTLYECNSFFTSKLTAYRKSLNNGYGEGGGAYTGDPTVYGVFDARTNKYIIALEEINRYNSQGYLQFHQDGYTLAFNEVRGSMEGFESFLSYKPENMVCLDTMLLTFKDGATYKHTPESTRCNFYGVQYDAYITSVFNDNGLQKKTWQALTELANDKWECPLIYTNTETYSGQRQESKLIPQNFAILEGDYHAVFKRDIHSIGGWGNGNVLKGNYIVIKFLKQNANEYTYLNGVSVYYTNSPLTKQ